jgi:hypothetical protein
MRRQLQHGLLVGAKYKNMEQSRREQGYPGGEKLKRPGPDAGCRANQEEEYVNK